MARAPQRRPRKAATGGSPGWMTTLADMFMLLLTFFILLLSFSSLDNEKYRAMVTSMVEAFNMAPRQIPDPSGLADPDEVVAPISEDSPIPLEGVPGAPGEKEATPQPQVSDQEPEIHPGVEKLAGMLISEMEDAVANEQVAVGFDRERVVIRFDDEATFPAGSARLIPQIEPVVEDIVGIVARCDGEVVVTGHTDDRPILSDQYRSNWDLSAARAVSLVHELVMDRAIPAQNVIAAGRAETRPIADNDTPEGREKNRRVEIEIFEPECEETPKNESAPPASDMELTPP